MHAAVVPVDKPNNLDAAVEFWTKIGQATSLPLYVYWIAKTADKSATADSVRSTMGLKLRPIRGFGGCNFSV